MLRSFDQRFHAQEWQRLGRAMVFPLLLFSVSFRPAPAQDAAAAEDILPVYREPGVIASIPLKKPDEDFVRASVAKYGSRTSASKAFAAQGWKLLRNNQRELALQDFTRIHTLRISEAMGHGGADSDRVVSALAAQLENNGTADPAL